MLIVGMEKFQNVCKNHLVRTYNRMFPNVHINLDEVYIMWVCKTLQNYKALASTTVNGDGVYVEYTYDGDKQRLYEDVYIKQLNTKYE